MKRITGRTLQQRRQRIWLRRPHCALCGALVAYPGGFELDHIVSLQAGGADTDENCQVLCIDIPGRAGKVGCHRIKTAADMGYSRIRAPQAAFDATGRVIW